MLKKLAIYSPLLKEKAADQFQGLAQNIEFIDDSGLGGDYDGLILCEKNISDEQLKSSSGLKNLILCGPHIHQFSWPLAKELGINIALPQGVNAEAISQNIFNMGKEYFSKQGKELNQINVGLLGYGKLGQAIAGKFREAGSEVLAFDTFPDHSVAGEQGVELSFSLEELLWDADLVTCQIPYFPMTHNLLDDANLRLMKRGTYYVHLSKVALMDSEALASLIDETHLAGASLYPCLEELDANSPLSSKENFSTNTSFNGSTQEEILTWVEDMKKSLEGAKTVEEYYQSHSWLDPDAD